MINGNAHTRSEFISYAIVSIVGLKGIDKAGKIGKLGSAASKVDNTLPYKVMSTDKLKDFVKTNVHTYMQQKLRQTMDLLKSNFSKAVINQKIQSIKNSEIITKARNTLEPTKVKATFNKIY